MSWKLHDIEAPAKSKVNCTFMIETMNESMKSWMIEFNDSLKVPIRNTQTKFNLLTICHQSLTNCVQKYVFIISLM